MKMEFNGAETGLGIVNNDNDIGLMGKTQEYSFEEILFCEMCGAPTVKHRILGQRLNQSQGLKPWKKEGISVSVKKCSNCQLIYSSPLPKPKNIHDHYGLSPEGYWKGETLSWSSSYFADQIVKAKELLQYTEGRLALDIGAGTGKGMMSMMNAGFDTYGLEPSKPFYTRILEQMHIDPSHLRMGMVEDVNYPDNHFDFINYGAVVEHLYHPAYCIEKALRWLKPGGVMHIEVPSSKHHIAKLLNFYYKLVGKNYVTHLSPMHSPFHLYEFGIKSFAELSRKLGCSIASHHIFVGSIEYIPGPLKPLFRKYMEATDTGMQLVVWLRK